MSKRKFPSVSMMVSQFEELRELTDSELVKRMWFVLSQNKKRLFPKNLDFDRYRINKGTTAITIHLCKGDVETARFQFVPAPIFRRD